MSALASSAPREEVPSLAQNYEDLRRRAICSNSEREFGVGMTLFVRSGMAAWMESCEELPKPGAATPKEPAATERILPDGLSAQVATLLADMALSVHAQGAVAP